MSNISVKPNSTHEALHVKSKKIARTYVRISIIGAIFCSVLSLVIILTKDHLKGDIEEKPEFADWKKFFALDEWIQWSVLGTLTAWLCMEIVFAKLLQYGVNNEARTCLKVWLGIYIVDSTLSYLAYIGAILFVMMTTKILLGIIGIVFLFYEFSYLRVILKYMSSLSRITTYEACQTEEEKV